MHYATRSDQLSELLEYIRNRDRRMYDALIVTFTGASAKVLAAIGEIVRFVALEAGKNG